MQHQRKGSGFRRGPYPRPSRWALRRDEGLRFRVEDTTPRTDDETGTLTVPSEILPPRSAHRKNHNSQSHSVSPPCRTPPAPCHAVRELSCLVQSTAHFNALVMLCVSCLVSLSKVVVHLPRRLAPTHLLLSLVLTPNQARGGRSVKPAVPPTSTCMWAVLKDRVATRKGY